jgi:SAM-dependent methyltransferase
MLRNLRVAIKYLLAPVIYRYPPFGLQPSELGIYLTSLLSRADVAGDVAEIGCSVGGTACIASALVRQYSPSKSYTCFDTFNGFVPEQVQADISLGTPANIRHRYSGSDPALVRRILDLHGASAVRLVQGDITTVPDDKLSQLYSVVLLDVDLEEPTYAALKRIYPRLNTGGIILIDDCRAGPEQVWRAQKGYLRFCQEFVITPQLRYGFGIVEK